MFSAQRNYRIFLPNNYASTVKRYPVVYFMHGWGGRYNNEPSANLDYTVIDSLINAADLIMVILDGRQIPGVTINVKTAPVYQPNRGYTL